jgi:DNA-binding winged helix-turn-helix (wHTH) protein
MKIKKITTFSSANASQTRFRLLLLLLQVHHSHVVSQNQLIYLEKGKGLYKDKGLEGEC